MTQQTAILPSANPANVPNRPTGFITLKYVAASVSALIATFTVAALATVLFELWTGKISTSTTPVDYVLSPVGLGTRGGYEAIVVPAVAAVLFALLAFFLYRNVTKEIGARPSYVQTMPYAVVTNGVVGILGILAVVYVARLVGTLLTSLLVIGTGADIGALYLSGFLPDLFVLGLLAFMVLMTYKIATGKNMSFRMSIVLLSVTSAVLVAILITVPINAHSASALPSSGSNSLNSSNMQSQQQQQLQQQYEQMYQQYLHNNY